MTGCRVMLVMVSNTSRRILPRSMSLMPGMRMPSWQISVAPGELPPGDMAPTSATCTNVALQPIRRSSTWIGETTYMSGWWMAAR